jgi:Ca2+-transporting ATPase
LLLQFHQPLVYLLLAAALIMAAMHEWVDSVVILTVLFANALIGFIQEGKAGHAIRELARFVRTEAWVRRAGIRLRIPSEELVPGDVVLLEAGDRVPADLRLLSVRNLRIDESALTGESLPVHKHADVLGSDVLLPDRQNLAFTGTLVTAGQAEGLVWATGDRTETGRIAWLIENAEELSTPLTQRIAEFSRLLLWSILILAAGTFGLGIFRGKDATEMFMAAVALAVGAIPEGLPAAVTIVLAIGVARMASRRAIIRRLPAVETLGSTTVICTDKTGTLTENAMTVREIYAGACHHTISGSGYDPEGQIDGDIDPALLECLKAGVLCNDAMLLQQEDGTWKIQGDPTEAALLVSARKGGLGATLGDGHPRLDVIPFTAEQQYMATLHRDAASGQRFIYKKGSVERLLNRCSDVLAADGTRRALDVETVTSVAERMAGEGLRVLAFARMEIPEGQATLSHEQLTQGLTFLGLQGMVDPPRPEAIQEIRRCREAGIQVKMITGDHLKTAMAIALQMGLVDGGVAGVTGRELDALSPEELSETADRTVIFARVAPEQKLRLVEALQSRGHVVSMTGDGVNDAPALRQADIGVAMGRGGPDVAKAAADMILTDDNFATIEAAVEEGRRVFENLKKFIVWTLPTNGGEALILLVAILLGGLLPILPIQLLWVNMTTDAIIGITLAFEIGERGLMSRAPRDPRESLLSFPLVMRIGLVSLLILAGGYGLFLLELAEGATLEQARTVVVNVIVGAEAFYLVSCRSLLQPARTLGVFSNPWLIVGLAGMGVAQLCLTYVPFMNFAFQSAPLGAISWFRIIAADGFILMVVALEKRVRYRNLTTSRQRLPAGVGETQPSGFLNENFRRQ